MDEVGLTHISLSVSDLGAVLAKVAEFGGTVVDAAVSEAMAMIRDPDGQLLELVTDGWLASPAHCENIMDGRFTLIGIAFAENLRTASEVFWTQDFATRR